MRGNIVISAEQKACNYEEFMLQLQMRKKDFTAPIIDWYFYFIYFQSCMYIWEKVSNEIDLALNF